MEKKAQHSHHTSATSSLAPSLPMANAFFFLTASVEGSMYVLKIFSTLSFALFRSALDGCSLCHQYAYNRQVNFTIAVSDVRPLVTLTICSRMSNHLRKDESTSQGCERSMATTATVFVSSLHISPVNQCNSAKERSTTR